MITQEFLESLDLSPDKAAALQDAMKKDSAYRNMLHRIGVHPGAVEAIMRTVDAAALDTDNMELLTEKARVEWRDFIPQKNSGRTADR